MVWIESDGERIIRTDYWRSEHARRGYVYLSVNAGAVRLLVPPQLGELLDAIRDARAARVQIAGAAQVGVVHVILDDDSPSPYVLTIDARQCDRSLPLDEVGRVVPLFGYTAANGVSTTACRLVTSIRAVVAQASTDPDLSPVVID